MKMAMPTSRDYYALLGLSRTATRDEVNRAFRRLARRYHPDLNPGNREAERRFKEISEAYDVLSDPEKRTLYDRFGDAWKGVVAGVDPGVWGARAPSGAGGRRAGSRVGSERGFPGFGGRPRGGFSDLLGSLFGFGGRPGAVPAPDAEREVEVSLGEAYVGTTRQVELPDGRRLELRVPAGVHDGVVLRAPGLRARVRVREDPTFHRHGKDLVVEVEVPLRCALLGGKVEVPTPGGTRVELRVPPETQNGTRLRLRGLGMPDPRGGGPGDLYAKVRVRLPLPLDERTRRWAEGLPA